MTPDCQHCTPTNTTTTCRCFTTHGFRRRLVMIRKNCGHSQQTLATTLQQHGHPTSQAAISRIERGDTEPTLADAYAISDALHIHPLSLIEGVVRPA